MGGEDPFTGLTDSYLDRKQRDDFARKQLRKQQLRALVISILATVLVAAATGIGAAVGGWAIDGRTDPIADRFLGGLVCGLVGGVCSLAFAFWRVIRRVAVADAFGGSMKLDIGATFFWSTVAGTILMGGIGATLGLAGRGGWSLEVLACAFAAGLLALIPAQLLRNATKHTSRTTSGATPYRATD